jgi:hypothetical protein
MSPEALRMRRFSLVLLLLAATVLPALAQPFPATGLWRLRHTDGSPFHVRLYADGSALSDFGSGENGTWLWEGQAVVCRWSDGWLDRITPAPGGGYVKVAWAPGADRKGPPSNRNRAVRVSPDPNDAAR